MVQFYGLRRPPLRSFQKHLRMSLPLNLPRSILVFGLFLILLGARGISIAGSDLPIYSVVAQADDTGKRVSKDSIRSGIAVLFPETTQPFASVFSKIADGIDQQAGGRVRRYPVPSSGEPPDLGAQLKRNGAKVVIALGRPGVQAAQGLDREIPVIVGGVSSLGAADSKVMHGISLIPDPALLFQQVKALMPGLKRITVVHNPQQNEWIMALARDAAKAQGLELSVQIVKDLASTAHSYENVFAAADPRRDAVWIPHDTSAGTEETIIPLVLNASWNYNVPVFSSSFLHVKKGVLFALIPNNFEMGKSLANMAISQLNGEPRKPGLIPLRDVSGGLNRRAAAHLGIALSTQQLNAFEYIYPDP